MMRNVGRAHPNNVYNNGQKFDKRNPTLTRINDERFAYAMTSLVGKDVIVGMTNGRLVRGRFHSFDPTSRTSSKAFDIALRNARYVSNRNDEGPSGRPFVIYGHEYNYVVEHGINMGSVNQETGVSVAGDTSATPYRDASKMSKLPSSTNFKTDTEISGSKGGCQNDKLTEWKADEPVNESALYELESSEKTEWDQFESNRKAFGIKSTYDENLYTTELKLDEVPREVKERAAKLASEIMDGGRNTSYSHLEAYLEQDEDNMCNPIAESIVKKALAKGMKDSKRDDKHGLAAKPKSRSPVDTVSGAHNVRPSSTNHSMSYSESLVSYCVSQRAEDAMSSIAGNSSSSGVKEPADLIRGDSHSSSFKAPIGNRDRTQRNVCFPCSVIMFVQSQRASISNREISAGRSDMHKMAPNSAIRVNARSAEDAKKGERVASLPPPQKNDDKSTPKAVDGDAKPIAPPVVSLSPPKKTFTFNPNASTFTPTSLVEKKVNAAPSIPTAANASVAKVSGTSLNAAVPTKAAGTGNAGDAHESAAHSHDAVEFKAFTPMVSLFITILTTRQADYPRLDVSSYTTGSWPMHDQPYDELWPNCSESSYRTIIGDISPLHPVPNVVGMRQQHPIVPAPGMATVILPQGGSVGYPGYQLGGIPVNVMPYTRQVTPKFFTTPTHKQLPGQPAPRRPLIGSHPQVLTQASRTKQPNEIKK
ncbi:ataxin-2 N-terminal region domain containing protein [Babesia divergens]|uniref:Ataxin-2 N-terminal region domain containing protein n=1 Tax=Babesia divergens TaxID=32595 RepID=A0AAD9LF81_BABDI|nr:ataxin-2 N-terminal region domain containing protein [Babesia divergens]